MLLFDECGGAVKCLYGFFFVIRRHKTLQCHPVSARENAVLFRLTEQKVTRQYFDVT